ncbi:MULTISPECIES: RDD family protein [Wolbachia]|uniref:RDD family protein n=1 Tax=Wolbachia TaxID=953 RepID=UPI00019865C6|nr:MULTISPECIES: RDD family protein [Wolbachia]MDX5487771.1 RDD family protein [Wolbachia endosymbiont of Andrena praecox]MDX5497703.1 RDD family protein [Wolbachia endosymbiont of Lasioglossum nitidulum]MDX5510061.1 RDD family protein [Wolbachia endosymbiont of Lasioglossum morio]MDX5542998.1 RDD family protein [Wolbachia endosymbiont of Andrena apicata]MDX5561973.1 RDD family protein [Wolbachia endosymbiont of Andrena bicolor]MDX5596302.1 RDD family protein [Wolbachia endosymbiont of Andren
MTEIASIKRRFCAYLVDVAILLIPTLLIILLLEDSPLILHLSYMCVICSYFTYFISSKAQATPGQQLLNIYTINLDNSKIDLNLAFDRSTSQFFLPLLNSVAVILTEFLQDQEVLVNVLSALKVMIVLLTLYWYLVACFSKKKQTYHDMLFNTVVIKGTIK